MKSEERLDSQPSQPTGVQHDSETPLPKKPSVLFIASTLLGVLVIILLTINAYYGVAR